MRRTAVGLAVAAVLSAAVPLFAQSNQVGINVDYLLDTDNTPLLSDLVRTYRTANLLTSTFGQNDAPIDSTGWATSDFWYFLGDPVGIKHGDGTYGIKFNGKATLQLGKTGGDGSVLSNIYDPLTNTTTAYVKTKDNVDLTDLRFINTQRDATSAVNTGVTNIQVQRPTTPGGNTPYAFGNTFTQQTIQIAQKTSALRFMDYLATNNNIQAAWTDRVKPTDVKLNPNMPRSSRGKGGPIELAVQLGNEANRDIWINVPALANDDYVLKLAQTIKYGSDGTNPYTSPQANPVFKPLNPNLRVYLEYSNETWNGQFLQQDQIYNLALAQVAAEKASGQVGPLTLNPTTNEYFLTQRYNALRTKQIADTFATVYGQDAMLNTVRPILAWQYGNGNDTANQTSIVLDGYFNNAKGNFVSNPTPIRNYIYGGGSAMYYAPTSALNELTVDKIVTEPAVQTASRTQKIIKDIAYTTTFGIHRVAYEGGLSLDPGSQAETESSMAAKLAALADSRMQQLVVTNHNTWTNQGGELLVYYFSTAQYKFAMSDENFSTTTPKLNALDQLNNSSATTDWSVGTPLTPGAPTVIAGGQYTIREGSGNNFDGPQALKAATSAWASYLINIAQPGDYSLAASLKTFGTSAAFQIQLGGAVLGDYTAFLSDAGYTSTSPITLTLPSGITSVRILLKPTSGDISLQSITFTPVSATPNPEPATALTLLTAGGLLLRRRRC